MKSYAHPPSADNLPYMDYSPCLQENLGSPTMNENVNQNVGVSRSINK